MGKWKKKDACGKGEGMFPVKSQKEEGNGDDPPMKTKKSEC